MKLRAFSKEEGELIFYREGLGHFLELEVVLEEGEPTEVGIREAHELMTKLGVEPSQLIEGAYVDLLQVP